MRNDVRYGPSDCFETFPFPRPSDARRHPLSGVGARYEAHRRSVCLTRRLGLTRIYNLCHNPATERDDAPVQKAPPSFDDIRHLRALHAEMDRAVLAAYGWEDVDPRHGFYQGRDAGTSIPDDDFRFTIHPEARAEILRRLLVLNYKRAAEEKELIEQGEAVPSAFSWLTTADH